MEAAKVAKLVATSKNYALRHVLNHGNAHDKRPSVCLTGDRPVLAGHALEL